MKSLGAALIKTLGEHRFRWIGSGPGPGINNVGWRLIDAPRFIFSVSTIAGALPDGVYDFQISISDDTLENGEIVFLDEVILDELCHVMERYAAGEVVERF